MNEKQLALTKVRLRNPIHFLALGFGSGLISPAPGTWGSLAGWLLGIAWLSVFSPLSLLLVAILGFAIGIYLCEKTSHDMGVHDHGAIVWDEIVAIWLVLALLPSSGWLWYLGAFLAFRLFDITKPYPISYFDRRLTNGFGIMVDDILAAIYSVLLLWLISLFY
ncbi:phosphatidylglycerophosphatase A family protein [Testudinibacter sp. P27/CKL/0425]